MLIQTVRSRSGLLFLSPSTVQNAISNTKTLSLKIRSEIREGTQLYDRILYPQDTVRNSLSRSTVCIGIQCHNIRYGLRARRRRKILRYFGHYCGGNASKVDHFEVGNFCRQQNTHLLSPGASKTDIFLKSGLFFTKSLKSGHLEIDPPTPRGGST